jgi:hypothetical protein
MCKNSRLSIIFQNAVKGALFLKMLKFDGCCRRDSKIGDHQFDS